MWDTDEPDELRRVLEYPEVSRSHFKLEEREGLTLGDAWRFPNIRRLLKRFSKEEVPAAEPESTSTLPFSTDTCMLPA